MPLKPTESLGEPRELKVSSRLEEKNSLAQSNTDKGGKANAGMPSVMSEMYCLR